MGNFGMLPVEIIFNILTRLPTESVLDCKLVSKSWNSIVNHQSFSQSHLNQCLTNLDSSGKFTFLVVNDNPIYAYRLFHYIEYYDDENSYRVTRIRLNPAPFMYYNLTGSCNGLVCLEGCHDNDWVNYEPVYICNPITRECVFLPGFKRTPDRGERLLSGFGYVSLTNEYKVVRMYKLFEEPDFVLVEVYTLGSGKGWRNLGKKFDEDPGMFMCRHGVSVNGSLYWKLGDGNIVAFDLANEVFVRLPKSFPTDWNFTLGVLVGYLSATHYEKDSKTFDILLLKKKEDVSLGWIKEFSLSDMDSQDSVVQDTLVLTCRGTVLCHSKTEVLSHDLNSSSSKVLVDFGKDKGIFQVIPHINTLVSLKGLGEENTKTMESVDVPREVVGEYMSEYDKKIEGFNQMCTQQ